MYRLILNRLNTCNKLEFASRGTLVNAQNGVLRGKASITLNNATLTNTNWNFSPIKKATVLKRSHKDLPFSNHNGRNFLILFSSMCPRNLAKLVSDTGWH